MSVPGEIEQLFEDGEVRSPMSGSAKAGEQLDGPLLADSATSWPIAGNRARLTEIDPKEAVTPPYRRHPK